MHATDGRLFPLWPHEPIVHTERRICKISPTIRGRVADGGWRAVGGGGDDGGNPPTVLPYCTEYLSTEY